MKILVVEDDFISRKLLVKSLSGYGECDVAVNGREAIDAFALALNDGPRYDLICLDIMMPEVDGLEALKKIRALETERGIGELDGVKIIMTTALGDKTDILEAFTSGCEAYLVKPLDRDSLNRTLKELGLAKG